MSKVRVLNQADILEVLCLPDVMEAVERAYVQKSTGEGGLWPMVFHEFDPGRADLDIKSGELAADGVFGFKLVSWFGENPGKNLPALFGSAMLFDIATGEPKALLNASAMTDLRTGAAGAIGAKYLARKDAENLLMVGVGELAPFQIAATLLALPKIKQVRLANPRHPERAGEKAAAITQKVDVLLKEAGVSRSADISAAEDVRAAVGMSHIIITATPSREPLISADWVRPGTHFSCVGADMGGKQEIDGAILGKATVVADDLAQCLEVGECEIPAKNGVLTPEKIYGEIGDIITGKLPGRTGEEEITVFDSTGIALQDLACGALALKRAEERNLGAVVEL